MKSRYRHESDGTVITMTLSAPKGICMELEETISNDLSEKGYTEFDYVSRRT